MVKYVAMMEGEANHSQVGVLGGFLTIVVKSSSVQSRGKMVSEGEELRRLAVENFQKGDYAAALEQARAVVGESEQNAMMWQICGLALPIGTVSIGVWRPWKNAQLMR